MAWVVGRLQVDPRTGLISDLECLLGRFQVRTTHPSSISSCDISPLDTREASLAHNARGGDASEE